MLLIADQSAAPLVLPQPFTDAVKISIRSGLSVNK